MYCSTCGNHLEDSHQYCPVCGTKAERHIDSVHAIASGNATSVPAHASTFGGAMRSNTDNYHAGNVSRYTPLPSQSWLRFLTSVVLPLCTLALIAIAASLFLGLIYVFEDVSKARIYGVFPYMETVDKVFAVGTLATAALCIAARKSLKWHHTNAIALATALFVSCLGLFLLYGAAVSVVIERLAFDTYSLMIAVAAGCFIALNLIYLNKRRSLFIVP